MEKKDCSPAWMHVAEIEIVYKSKVKAADRPQIKKSKDAYDLLLRTWDDNTLDLLEEFKVVLLNRANRVLGIINVSKGGLTGTVADVRIILAAALKSSCTSLILAHSHPSGNTKPSRTDEELTERVVAAAKLMDIRVMDHIIVTREQFYSFADEGLI